MIARLALLLVLFWPGLATAQPSALSQALGVPELAQILFEEATHTGREVDENLLGGEGGSVFAAQVSAIFDADQIAADLDERLSDLVSEDDLAKLLIYLQSEQGQQAVSLEMAARRAFLDPEVETFAQAQFESSPHKPAIENIIRSGEMIRQNRETAQLTTEAFYRGMRAGGALDLGDDDITALAREQAAEGDAETLTWLQGYFALAYSPLDTGEMAVIVAFWETDVGARFSEALYDAFDAVYGARWYAMGQAAALFLNAEDI